MRAQYKSGFVEKIDILILCGGIGSRLQSIINDRPKGMALIEGRPFLDILVEDLLKQGFQNITFCVGHLKEQIINHYKFRKDAVFKFSEEDTPLGTGGAIKNACPKINHNLIIVINGDSLCKVNFSDFIKFHFNQESAATFVLANPQDRCDGGTVLIDDSSRIHSFLEKTSNKSLCKEFINAGIYILDLNRISFSGLNTPFSLEYDIFPKLVKEHACYGFLVDSELTDIGTPERYLKANNA